MEIEVFRSGNAAAAAAGITAAHLAELAAGYDGSNPVPCVIGHPQTDSPAAGAVVKFRAAGNSLYADVPETSPAFQPIVDGIKGDTILGRSMAFFGPSHPSNPTPGKFAPKHLGFLGAAAVGIPGMPTLKQSFAFSADDALEIHGDPAPAVVFEAAPTEVITVTETPEGTVAPTQEHATVTEAEQLAADRAAFAAEKAAHEAQVASFAANAKTARETRNTATVKALVTEGKVLPADEADLVAAFNAVDGDDVIEFASDKAKASPVARIAAIMAKGGKVAPTGDAPFSPSGDAPTFAASGDAATDLAEVRRQKAAKYGK